MRRFWGFLAVVALSCCGGEDPCACVAHEVDGGLSVTVCPLCIEEVH